MEDDFDRGFSRKCFWDKGKHSTRMLRYKPDRFYMSGQSGARDSERGKCI